jgi:glycosyltransferase involved in cell wall biosynthesis
MTWANRIQSITYNDPDTYPPIVNSARLLARHGFAVDLLCRDTEERWGVAYPDRVRVERIQTAARGSVLAYVLFVAAVLRRGRRSALYVGHDAYGVLPAWLLAARHRRPWVYHCHDFSDRDQPLHIGGRIVRWLEGMLARTADLVIVPDANRGQVVARALGLRRPPLIVANAPLRGAATSGEALSQALRGREGTVERVVFRQGRVGPGHAVEATVRSIPYWADTRWGFVVMGIGRASYRERLEALARSLGVADRFVILPPVGYDRVREFTSGADVGHALYEPVHVNNVHITTASNKIMEYMAAGVPLLVSDRPALRALVEQHGCGLAADEGDPGSIAAAVNALLGDRDRARHMGEAGRVAFDRVFCYDVQFAPVLEAFQGLIQVRGRTGQRSERALG